MIRNAAVAAALLCAVAPAAAFEPTGNAVADALVRGFITGNESAVEVGPVTEADGSVFVDFLLVEIEGVDIGTGAPLSLAMRLSDLRLEGASLEGDVLIADRLLIDAGRYEFADDLVTATILTTDEMATGLALPPSAFSIETDFAEYLRAFQSYRWGPTTYALDAPDGGIVLPNDGQSVTVEQVDGALVVTAAVDGLVVDLGATPMGPVLEDAGLSPLVVDGRGDLLWDDTAGELELRDFSMTASKAGELSASGRFLAGPDPGGALEQLSVTFRDAGATRALLGLAGAMQGMSADAMAQFAANTFSGAVLAVNDMAFATATAEAVRNFLTDPQRLTVTLDPPVPLPFTNMDPTRFEGPADFVRALGVSVSAD